MCVRACVRVCVLCGWVRAYIELVNECVCELDRAKAKVCSALLCVCACVCVCSVCSANVLARLQSAYLFKPQGGARGVRGHKGEGYGEDEGN